MPIPTPLLDTIETPHDVRKLSPSQLPQLASELRAETIDAAAVSGGHFGAGLGVIELTVALHYVFDTPQDRLIWDVSHQAYPHKILTGRRSKIRNIRQRGGLYGFAKRDESIYDAFGAAHSSTSISAGLGMAVARDLKGEKNNVIAVIGDGAMSAGMAYEAMNNAGAKNSRLIVILNDNEMSIAPPVGALSGYLARLISGRTYTSLREIGKQIAKRMPKSVEEKALRVEEYARGFLTGGTLFEEAFPERTFDVGIAEQHGVTFAAGLATEGYKPFVAIYSTFLQRAYDQIVHDVAIQGLPVRFAIDRAGLVGADGPTHAGSFDVAYLGCLPGFVIMAAAGEAERVHMVATQVAINDRPSAVRYPRGEGRGVEMPEVGIPLEIGKGRIVREGKKVALLSFGTRLAECEKAADELAAHGLSATIADARFMKPLDEELVLKLARDHEILITIEEGAIGGFGSHVMQYLSDNGMLDNGLPMRSMILPDVFFDHDTPNAMYGRAGLDAKGIVAKVFETLGKDFKTESVKLA